MYKSILSFVMALVFVAVSVVGLNYGVAFQAKAAEAQAASTETKASTTSDAITNFFAGVSKFLFGGDGKERNILGFCWSEQDRVFYSSRDAWQRNFGYNKIYDIAAPFILLNYDTCRVKFNYGGKDWLIQFWKGQYGLFLIGAEVGVYCKDENQKIPHYECANDNERFALGYSVFNYNEKEPLFVRTYENTWWLTGFIWGKIDSFADRSQLSMQLRITLKDEEMREKFVEALKKPGVGFKEGNATDREKDTFQILGNDVYIMWNTDRNSTS